MEEHSDIVPNDWVDRNVPRGARPYARLMRLDRPIGTWLLLWPCWWSVALASEGPVSLWLMFLFGIGAVLMRGAGCAINDMWDREIDGKVERTRTRPLASGALSLRQALIFTLALLLAGLVVLLQFNALTVWLGVASLAIVLAYPLAKRVTWAPQLVLGLAFNWGALMGWASVRGEVGLPAFLLYAAGIFWTLAYDTIYAFQDKRDDATIGIKSLALKLGGKARLWVAGFFDIFFLFALLAGWRTGAGTGFYIVMGAALLHALWQLVRWKTDAPVSALKIFRANRDFGLLVFLAVMAGKLF